MQLEKLQRDALGYLARSQLKSGLFAAEASSDQTDFSHPRRFPAIFPTALIGLCLEHVREAEALQKRLLAALMRERKPGWTWNYWQQGSAEATHHPYPDDLDDTACTLAAVSSIDSGIVDSSALAEIAKLLIATETQPGGPYRTWLVNETAPAAWQDVDVAVNANVGYFLHRQGVALENLNFFLDQVVASRRLISPYYVGEAPVIYFLARWLRGTQTANLRLIVQEKLKKAKNYKTNPLEPALMITAGLHLGITSADLEPALEQILLQQRRDGSWPAAALYRDPEIDDIKYIAGSNALTTAFCLEAITLYQRLTSDANHHAIAASGQSPAPSPALAHALAHAKELRHHELRRRYETKLGHLAAHDPDGQITTMASIITRATEVPLDETVTLRLNLGSLHGWLAYTIYDDILDNEGELDLLPTANLALRASVANFRAALPQNKPYLGLIDDTFNQVDEANTWEVAYARAGVTHRKKQVHLPNYHNYAQLAHRSWGHALAGVGVLVAQGHPASSTSVRQLQTFFRHLLIARQLNDDAHDWEADLDHGRITSVVTLLLQECSGKKALSNLAGLRWQFWNSTIEAVVMLIKSHTRAAHQALKNCPAIREASELEHWLERLEQAAHQALKEQQGNQQFIATFNRPGDRA